MEVGQYDPDQRNQTPKIEMHPTLSISLQALDASVLLKEQQAEGPFPARVKRCLDHEIAAAIARMPAVCSWHLRLLCGQV